MKLLPVPVARPIRMPSLRSLPPEPEQGAVMDPVDVGDPLEAAVDWALYVDGKRQPPNDFASACAAARQGQGFVWLGLFEPTVPQLNGLEPVFGLHPLALEDASGVRQRP